MSYEARDGGATGIEWVYEPEGFVMHAEEAVTDALDVLRAAGWTVTTEDRGWGGPATRVWAWGPWRKVDGADDGE